MVFEVFFSKFSDIELKPPVLFSSEIVVPSGFYSLANLSYSGIFLSSSLIAHK